MINYKNYIGCEVEVTESIEGKEYITKGTLVGVSDDCLDIYARGKRTTEPFITLPIAKEVIVGFECTKKAKDLTLKEWELYFKNVYDSKVPLIFRIEGCYRIHFSTFGSLRFLDDDEIDMLKVYREALE